MESPSDSEQLRWGGLGGWSVRACRFSVLVGCFCSAGRSGKDRPRGSRRWTPCQAVQRFCRKIR